MYERKTNRAFKIESCHCPFLLASLPGFIITLFHITIVMLDLRNIQATCTHFKQLSRVSGTRMPTHFWSYILTYLITNLKEAIMLKAHWKNSLATQGFLCPSGKFSMLLKITNYFWSLSFKVTLLVISREAAHVETKKQKSNLALQKLSGNIWLLLNKQQRPHAFLKTALIETSQWRHIRITHATFSVFSIFVFFQFHSS